MKRKIQTIQAGSHVIELGRETKVMGIINMTPDSFSRDGLAGSFVKAERLAARMIKQGAHILDVGGESSRPGSQSISIKEECGRIIPLVKALTKKNQVPVSVDTYKPHVAREALDAGASIINTIKGLNPDKNLLKVIRDYGAAIVVMHMRGTPKTMQNHVSHRNVVEEVLAELGHSVKLCLDAGIKKNHIMVDPGIGFGKTVEHNLQLLNHLDRLRILGCPVLIGVSRKSFIGHILNQPVEKRLAGSLSAACLGVSRGAHIVRVHDVSETIQAVRAADAIINSPF